MLSLYRSQIEVSEGGIKITIGQQLTRTADGFFKFESVNDLCLTLNEILTFDERAVKVDRSCRVCQFSIK